MRLGRLVLLATLVLAPSIASAQIVRIADDPGGRIGTFVDKYQNLRTSGQTVVIDGLCASACTIVLGALPRERILFTPRAILGFHAAWDFGPNGREVTNREATQMLYSMYPQDVRRWIANRGGLTRKMIFMKANGMAALGYRQYLSPTTYANALPR